MEKTGFILLPGAGLGAWIWREVAPLLKLPSLAINYPQRDHDQVERHYTLEDYANQAIWQVNNWDYDRYIIVAHSIGGLIGMRVAQKFRKKLAGFVAVSAVIPEVRFSQRCRFRSGSSCRWWCASAEHVRPKKQSAMGTAMI
jgi:pimeloyl-ACP methyl ester carboxylesterase